MNKKTVAYLDAHNERPTQKSGSGPAAKGSGPAADIAVVKAAALRIHKDSSIGSRERPTPAMAYGMAPVLPLQGCRKRAIGEVTPFLS